MVFEAAAGNRERLDQAGNVLLGPNGPGVEKKRVTDLVAFEDAMTLTRGILWCGRAGVIRRTALQEQRVRRVIDEPDAVRRRGHQVDHVALCRAGDGDDAAGPLKTPPQAKPPDFVQESRGVVIKEAAQIVNRHCIGFGKKQRNPVQRDVGHVRAQAADETRKFEVIETRGIAALMDDGRKVGGQIGELRFVFGRTDDVIMVIRPGGGQGLQQIADIGAYAEIADATGVDGNVHVFS